MKEGGSSTCGKQKREKARECEGKRGEKEWEERVKGRRKQSGRGKKTRVAWYGVGSKRKLRAKKGETSLLARGPEGTPSYEDEKK